MTFTILFLIALALTFDFLNGFHDSANSIATVVSTRVLSPRYAVLWAAFFNFIAFLFFGLNVAGTIGKGIIDIRMVQNPNAVIFGTLVGACAWDLFTWYFGLPTSSSHALMGGMIGAALASVGPQSLLWPGIIKTLIFIFVAPVIGLVLGFLLGVVVYRLAASSAPAKVDHIFRKGQLVSAALYSLGHGGNDAQKTMGIIAGLLLSVGLWDGRQEHIPLWVVLSCHAGHRPRNDARRLARGEDHGPEGRQAQAGGRVLRRGRRGDNAVHFLRVRHSGEHHPHHHRRPSWGSARSKG